MPGRLIVLPEYSFTAPPSSPEEARTLAEPLNGPTAQTLSTLANQNAAHVVGSFIEQADGKLFSTAMLVGPDGKTIGTYRKTHLEQGDCRPHCLHHTRTVVSKDLWLRQGPCARGGHTDRQRQRRRGR